MNHTHRQSGMTLIEMMISLLIGAILLAGVLQIFISSKQTYRMQDGLSRLQENARFAMEFLTYDLRLAGYQGCPSINAVTPNIIAEPLPDYLIGGQFMAINGANAVSNDWSEDACGDTDACIAGTDTVSIVMANNCAGQLTGNMGTANANIQIDANNTCGIAATDPVLISDCKAADLFRATSASNGNGKQTIAHSQSNNTSNFLSTLYQRDAKIYGLRATTYFLRTGESGQPALWRYDANRPVEDDNNPIELIEGIEDLQIVYGLDTDSDGVADRYVDASQVTDWRTAISVRLTFSARTLIDHLTTTGDGRLRRTLSTTVALRNKLR